MAPGTWRAQPRLRSRSPARMRPKESVTKVQRPYRSTLTLAGSRTHLDGTVVRRAECSTVFAWMRAAQMPYPDLPPFFTVGESGERKVTLATANCRARVSHAARTGRSVSES